jgi:hypothetical protein
MLARATETGTQSVSLLCFALAPFLVINTLGVEGRFEDDWPQALLFVPVVLHAFVLSMASHRWPRLRRPFRVAFLAILILSLLPPMLVAARYSAILTVDPERGHEFFDNRPIAEALAVIPTTRTVIVTNDLRYPAERFSRDDRQMQIPALFGHQAFAANFAYESYPFVAERREAQALLQRPEWSPQIERAARLHGWTHLLIRQDYVHPDPIPLERIFDNGTYAVFRFNGS